MIKSNNYYCFILFLYLFLFAYAFNFTANASESKKIFWQNIKVLDLETAQWIALAENKDFAASTYRIGQAMFQKKQAKASYWPEINFLAGAVRTKLSDTLYNSQVAPLRIVDPMAELDDPIESYTLSLSISYALFDGFLSKNNYLTAKLGYEITKKQHLNYKRILLQQVANLFFKAQLARENVAIAEANIDFYQQKLDEAKARQNIGSGSLSDALNFQVQLNSARTTLIYANETYQLALLDMANSMGITGFSNQVTLAGLETEKEKDLSEPDIMKYIEKAFNNRPEIALYQKMINQAEKQKEATKAYLYPFVKIKATYQGERKNNYHWGDPDFGNTITANITYPIFAGGYYQAKIKQAQFKLSETLTLNEYIKKGIETNVRKATERVKTAQKQVQLQKDNAKLVQRNRDLVEKEYAAGQNSLVRLNEAQKDLITAKSRSAASLVSLHQAWKNLMAETGQILLSFE